MSFGGFGGDLSQRAQILLQLRSEGTTDLEAVRAQIALVKSQVIELGEAYKTGEIPLRDQLTTLKEYNRVLGQLSSVERLLAREHTAAAEATRAHTEAIANAAGTASAWGKVIEQSKANVAAFTQALQADAAAAAQQKAALEATLIPLASVQVAGLKFQDQLRDLASGKKKGTEAANQFGYSILHVSHAFQDMQYGMAAAINNIPLIVTSLGGGPGLAGTLMAVGVGIQIASDRMGALKEVFAGIDGPARRAAESIESLKDRIKELEAKPIKMAVDLAELDEAKRRVKELEEGMSRFRAAAEGKTIYEKQAGEAVKGEFEGEGGRLKDATAKMVGQLAQELQASSPIIKKVDAVRATAERNIAEYQAAIAAGESADEQAAHVAGIEMYRKVLAKAEEDARKTRTRISDQEAPALIGGLLKDVEAGNRPESRAKLAGRLRAAGEEMLATRVEVLTPEAMQEREATDEEIAVSEERAKKATKRAQRIRRESDARQVAQERADEDNRRLGEQGALKMARERDQEAARQATLFGTKFGQAGDLPMEILGRMRAGKDAGAGLAETVRGLLDGVPADMAGDVADRIVGDAVAKVRAEVAAAGGGKGGVNAAIAARQGKLDRAMDAAGNREARQALGQNEAMMAEQIAMMVGGLPQDQGVVAAAHIAMGAIRKGADQQVAMLGAIRQVLADVANMAERAGQMQMIMAGQVGGVQAQVGRQRARRPGMLPHFQGH